MRRTFAYSPVLVFLILFCNIASASVSVSLSPSSVHVQPGVTTQFTAVVKGTTNNVVVWNLSGLNCEGNSCGQITSGGLYLAPPTAPASNVVTVTATALADLSKSAEAVAIIGSSSDVAVSVSPSTANILIGQQQTFVATVSGTTVSGVHWAISGSGCSGATCGTITTTGIYTAPAAVPSPAQVSVTASSVADPSRSNTATVTVIPPVAVRVSPASAQVVAGTQKQFTATVTGSTNTNVTWGLSGSGCSGASCGTISSGGLYTAPTTIPSPPQVTAKATSVADNTKSSTATITVIPPVVVTVSPTTAQVVTGAQQQFTATVTGTTNTGVTWSLAGSGCSGSSCGTITTAGLYTAPATIPSPAQVYVTATSVADPTKSSTATATIVPPVAVTVSPASAQVVTGAQKQFTATVTGTSNTSVTWSLSGSGCSGASCGTITSGGLYTAPSAIPSPSQVTVTATSVADTTKSSTAKVTVIAPVAVTISPTSAQVVVGAQKQFTATVTGTSNTSVTWSLSGSGCSGSSCGTITSAGLYTAPATIPSPAQVFATATSQADATKSSTATVTVIPPVAVSVSPTSAQVVLGAQKQFTATVTGSSNTSVTWSLSGSGCSGSACGTITTGGLYTAPANVPSPATVTVKATSVADSTKSGLATVTVVPPVAVSVTPTTAQVVAGAQQQFTATVTGTSNNTVTWTVSGSGCSGTTCGTISSSGLYTAPGTVPNPPQVTVTATSAADTMKSATATVTVEPPIFITVTPTTAQVVVGAQQQFTATVTGTSNKTVTWSVSGLGCSGAGCGTITSSGLYTAPATIPNPAAVTVTATSVVNSSRSGIASVTVLPPIAVTISPTTAQVVTGTQQRFTATVSGTTNIAVTWSVSGAGCSGASCGVINSVGVYTAPAAIPSPSRVTVTVTSVADTTRSASATVTIIPPVIVSITPKTANVVVGAQQQFTATVTNSSNTNVTWSVSGAGCSGSTCGTVTSGGLYTAPAALPSPQKVTVTATSVADPTKSANATVTITAPVSVSVSPASAQVIAGAKQQFTATVSGTSNLNVTWSLSGTGCSGTACGDISATGLYTAPPTLPNPPHVTITARSQADSTKTGTATVNLVQPPIVTVTPAQATTAVNDHLQFRAIVAGSNTTSVAWSVSGPGCAGVACGTISAGGLYTAPASVPSPATIIVKASAQVDVQQSASAIVTVVGSDNAKLTGQYAFQFDGFDKNGVFQAVGSITADGNGNVSGREDVNRTAGPRTNTPLTGSYQLGQDNRGVLTLMSALGTQTFRFALNATGSTASMIEFDTTGVRGSGVLEQQDSTGFSTSALQGGYAFALTGQDEPGARIGTVGAIYLNGSGEIIVGSLDVNDNGIVSPTYAVSGGTYSVDSQGRGTFVMDIPGFGTGVSHFAFYVVSASELVMVETDQLSSSNSLFVGSVKQQVGLPYQSSEFNATTIFSMAGASGNSSQVTVGRVTFDGMSQILAEFDEDTAGTITPDTELTGAYDLQINGRGRLDLDNSNGLERIWVIYATAPNQAFVMDGSTAYVGVGELKPQTTKAPFTSSVLVGQYVLGSGEPLVPGSTVFVGVTGFDGKGNISGTEDISYVSALAAAQTITGTYSFSSGSSVGRAVGLLTSPSSETVSIWVTSPSEALGLGIDSTNINPVVLHFEQ